MLPSREPRPMRLPPGPNGPESRIRKRKRCPFTALGIKEIDYKITSKKKSIIIYNNHLYENNNVKNSNYDKFVNFVINEPKNIVLGINDFSNEYNKILFYQLNSDFRNLFRN